MSITFLDPIAEDESGISVRALVDGKTFVCLFTIEALQDINPDTRFHLPSEQYEFNQHELQSIAERLILEDNIKCETVRITSADVRA
jgi:hypothetical protein